MTARGEASSGCEPDRLRDPHIREKTAATDLPVPALCRPPARCHRASRRCFWMPAQIVKRIRLERHHADGPASSRGVLTLEVALEDQPSIAHHDDAVEIQTRLSAMALSSRASRSSENPASRNRSPPFKGAAEFRQSSGRSTPLLRPSTPDVGLVPTHSWSGLQAAFGRGATITSSATTPRTKIIKEAVDQV